MRPDVLLWQKEEEVLRSSELKHCKKRKLLSGSLVIALVVAVSIVTIPFGCFLTEADAVTEKQFRTLEMAVNELKIKNDKKIAKEALEKKMSSESETKESTESTVETKETVAEEVKSIENNETDINQEIKTVSATEKVEETVPTTEVHSDYSPQYVSLSEYDRSKLERLVEGEAGGLGYDGCLLVAQAIRDSMNLSGTNSIDKIISDYSYSGSTEKQPSDAAKKAVSYIFDNNGYAVNHRVLYFYATDIVYSEWHETQNYITTCGNMRFFDKSF